MKRIFAMILAACLLCIMGGCAKKEAATEQPVPTIRIAHGVYQYDHGYTSAEGWLFDMTISAEHQMDELNRLVDSVRLELTDEDFLMHSGYMLVWRDAAGNVTDELLILSESEASRDGMVYEMTNAEDLIRWLDALALDEQNVTN